MSSSPHWVFRLAGGKMIARSGATVSSVALGAEGPKTTQISFKPGIDLSDDEHKSMVVRSGYVTSGWATALFSKSTIILADESRTMVELTSCR